MNNKTVWLGRICLALFVVVIFWWLYISQPKHTISPPIDMSSTNSYTFSAAVLYKDSSGNQLLDNWVGQVHSKFEALGVAIEQFTSKNTNYRPNGWDIKKLSP